MLPQCPKNTKKVQSIWGSHAEYLKVKSTFQLHYFSNFGALHYDVLLEWVQLGPEEGGGLANLM